MSLVTFGNYAQNTTPVQWDPTLLPWQPLSQINVTLKVDYWPAYLDGYPRESLGSLQPGVIRAGTNLRCTYIESVALMYAGLTIESFANNSGVTFMQPFVSRSG